MIADSLIGRRGPNGVRPRGSIESLPSGSLRAKIYAGYDPVSGKRHYLDEVVPTGPRAAAEAEKVRTWLLREVDVDGVGGVRRRWARSTTVGWKPCRASQYARVEPATPVHRPDDPELWPVESAPRARQPAARVPQPLKMEVRTINGWIEKSSYPSYE